jgi:hypothetical protein
VGLASHPQRRHRLLEPAEAQAGSLSFNLDRSFALLMPDRNIRKNIGAIMLPRDEHFQCIK